MSGDPAMAIAIALFAIGAFMSYWIIRLGVSHGVRDAMRNDLLNWRSGSAGRYGESTRGPSGEQL